MKRLDWKDSNNQVDLLVIGGGITGVSVARDAVLRGLSTVLVEKADFASGTSSKSTKLLHGGLRYLEQFQFRLVRESCRERELMLRLAPHIGKVRPFIYLLYRGYPETYWKLNVGLTLYDLFSGSPIKRRHHMLGRDPLLKLEPDLNSRNLVGGGLYYDALIDDVRLTIDVAKSAAEAGALLGNYFEVTDFVYEKGKIIGAKVMDLLSGAQVVIRAKQVVNATGVWVDRVRFLEAGVSNKKIRPTKGVHIVLRKSDFSLNHAIFLRSPKDQRIVWPIPSLDGDLVYVGTTDTDYRGSLEEVAATEEDIDYLLQVANHAIPGRRLGFQHVVSTWAGLRPLVGGNAQGNASSVSREHEIFWSAAGLLNVAGGKITTARIMGAQVVQTAIEAGRIPDAGRSVSHLHQISGGDLEQGRNAETSLAAAGISPAAYHRWLGKYGSNAAAIRNYWKPEPPVDESLPYLTFADVRYAVQEEMARTVTDFFARRSSIFFWVEDGGLSASTEVADEMGRLLSWTGEEKEKQIEAYRQLVFGQSISEACRRPEMTVSRIGIDILRYC